MAGLDIKGLIVLILNTTASDKDLELKMGKLNKTYTISREKGGWLVNTRGDTRETSDLATVQVPASSSGS